MGKLDGAFPPIRFPQLDLFSGEPEVYYGIHPQTTWHTPLTITLLIKIKLSHIKAVRISVRLMLIYWKEENISLSTNETSTDKWRIQSNCNNYNADWWKLLTLITRIRASYLRSNLYKSDICSEWSVNSVISGRNLWTRWSKRFNIIWCAEQRCPRCCRWNIDGFSKIWTFCHPFCSQISQFSVNLLGWGWTRFLPCGSKAAVPDLKPNLFRRDLQWKWGTGHAAAWWRCPQHDAVTQMMEAWWSVSM